jgi:hypothetical protein|tara:strand:+ start:12735 stop:13010 length:276 start_codon:yes stop_codon:yes gene_type:complete
VAVQITYATKGLLRDINQQAIENGYNRAWDVRFLETLPEAHYPVYHSAIHNEEHMRVVFMLDQSGTEAPLDMSFEEFEHLPRSMFEDEEEE